MKLVRFYTYIIIVCAIFNGIQSSAEGFAAGTLVKVPHGYVAIEDLKIGDLVICRDNRHKLVVRPIFYIMKKHVHRYAQIIMDDEVIRLSVKQKLYNKAFKSWMTVQDVKNLYVNVVELKNEPIDVYILSIVEYHNFFVSKGDIGAHNFIPALVAGISFLFGSGIELAGISCGLASLGTYFGYKWHKNKQSNIEISPVIIGGMMPSGPEDEDEKKQKRDQVREGCRPLTNKEAREIAEELGFKQEKNPPFDAHGELVFKKDNIYISPDNTGHRGGYWKRFNRKGKRLGTWNKNLTQMIGD